MNKVVNSDHVLICRFVLLAGELAGQHTEYPR
jgi:hypothetical protein